MAREKPVINIAFIGHVDAGKSTTIGRLLYDSGAIDPQTIEKYRREAEAKGKAGFEFAYVMDGLKEERERGVTIDIAHKKFETPKYEITIIDCPGHKDFIKNMITGASQADAAVLVVDVNDHKAGRPQPQTQEHVFLARTLGINQLIVAINKMDTVNYSQEDYEKTKEMIANLIKMVGYDPSKVNFVPVASLKGDNIVKKSENMPWYNGPTLVEALDLLEAPNLDALAEEPLRLPIQDAYNITGVGLVPVGRVETGVMRPGDKVIVNPTGVIGEVKSIEMHHQAIPEARPGDNVGFNLKGVDKKAVRRGSVVGHPDNPPTVAEEFVAQIVVLNHPTMITVGYKPVVHCHTAQVACSIVEIIKKIDPRTGQEVTDENEKHFLRTGDAAIVRLKPEKDMCVETKAEFGRLGSFSMRDMGRTVAAGFVIEVKPKNN